MWQTDKAVGGCLRCCYAVVEEDGVKEWWGKVRTMSGKIGGAKVDENFDGLDSLALTTADMKLVARAVLMAWSEVGYDELKTSLRPVQIPYRSDRSDSPQIRFSVVDIIPTS